MRNSNKNEIFKRDRLQWTTTYFKIVVICKLKLFPSGYIFFQQNQNSLRKCFTFLDIVVIYIGSGVLDRRLLIGWHNNRQ